MPRQPRILTSITLVLAGLILTFTGVQAQTSSDVKEATTSQPLSRTGVMADNLSQSHRILDALSRPSPVAISQSQTSITAEKAGAPASADQFVKRNGSMLLLNGLEFRFASTNLYYRQHENGHGNAAGVNQALDRAVELGLTVIRAWGFNDRDRRHPGDEPAAARHFDAQRAQVYDLWLKTAVQENVTSGQDILATSLRCAA